MLTAAECGNDQTRDRRAPLDPAGRGDGARVFALNLRPVPMYRMVYDPDERSYRDRLAGRW